MMELYQKDEHGNVIPSNMNLLIVEDETITAIHDVYNIVFPDNNFNIAEAVETLESHPGQMFSEEDIAVLTASFKLNQIMQKMDKDFKAMNKDKTA